ncbi:MAG: transposase [Armatimonadetes bacterium]|nr:transposase [Armatimonadota bacterium]
MGVRNDDTGAYHLYLTNIPADRLSPEDIARTYAARWEVELIFKELKSHYRLEEIPTTNAL